MFKAAQSATLLASHSGICNQPMKKSAYEPSGPLGWSLSRFPTPKERQQDDLEATLSKQVDEIIGKHQMEGRNT